MLKYRNLEIEFEWDHGPDLTIVYYGHRTHIVSASWSAYPVLGGAKDPFAPAFEFRNCTCGRMGGHWETCPAYRPENSERFEPGSVLGETAKRMVEAAYEITHDPLTEAIESGVFELTFYPPGDVGIRRLMEQLPVPPKGMRLSVKGLMDAVYRSVGMDRPPYVSDDDGDFVA